MRRILCIVIAASWAHGQLADTPWPMCMGNVRHTGRLLDMPAIPSGAAGTYQVIVGIVPAGIRPLGAGDAIPGYVDSENVTVRYPTQTYWATCSGAK